MQIAFDGSHKSQGQTGLLRTIFLSMKLSTALTALLSFASTAVFSTALPVQDARISACPAADRVLVETRNITAAGHEFQVSTKACSAAVLGSRAALEKRITFNSCAAGEKQTFTCVTNQGVGPTAADCDALETAMKAAYLQPGEPALFTVNPQFVQEFSLGTCLWAWFNTNPVGGAILEYCYADLTNILGADLDMSCIDPGNTAIDTGGYVIPSNPALDQRSLAWVFEVLHS
ncbi:hypothetical protein DFH06DRAFT_1236724 [Mycena polygramma]|nr:hypothetical protein DFH06DRAFT_1236724 [Mycena polygramma]